MIRRLSGRSIVLGIAAPVAALVFAALVSAAILAATGHSVIDVFHAMYRSLWPDPRVSDIGPRPRDLRRLANSVNSATTYYFSALAVAIGFRMNLFNIGVDGQYRLAAMLAAAFAGSTFMDGVPAVLRVTATIVVAMLVGMPQLRGSSHSYALDFPTGLGFTGIAIALLGRNSPVGMAFAALLWGVLDQSANVLDLSGVPKEIVAVMQGVIVLSVVVAYELVRRYRLRLEQRDVGRALGTASAPPAVEVTA